MKKKIIFLLVLLTLSSSISYADKSVSEIVFKPDIKVDINKDKVNNDINDIKDEKKDLKEKRDYKKDKEKDKNDSSEKKFNIEVKTNTENTENTENIDINTNKEDENVFETMYEDNELIDEHVDDVAEYDNLGYASINKSLLTLIMVRGKKMRDLNIPLDNNSLKAQLSDKLYKEFGDILIYDKNGENALLFRVTIKDTYKTYVIRSDNLINDLNNAYRQNKISFEEGQGEWSDNQAIATAMRKYKPIYEKDKYGNLAIANIKLKNNFVMFPAVKIAESLNAEFLNNGDLYTIKKNGLTLSFKANDKILNVKGIDKEAIYTLPIKTYMINDTVYVEPSLFTILLEGTITYDRDKSVVMIEDNNKEVKDE